MIRLHSSQFLRYLSATVLPVLAVLVSLLLKSAITAGLFLPFLATVFLVTWFSGLGPGLVASGLSFLLADFFFVAPFYSLAIAGTVGWGLLLTQLVLSLAIAYTVARRQTSARLLSTIISGMGEGIIATDHRGLIRFINPAAQELTGWTRGEAAGRPSRDVLR